MNATIAVLGAGSWGTALAMQLARNGQQTLLWGRDTAQLSIMARDGCNHRYLPGIPFPTGLRLESDLSQVLAEATHLLLAVPSHAFRNTLQQLRPFLKTETQLAWATKGLEQGSRKMLHQIVAEELGAWPCAVISGPTFAAEVARGLPTAVTVAADNVETANLFANALHGGTFRAYTSGDMIGVELGGACKNVLAIATGIADGLGFGANTRAALITRGLAEMMRLGAHFGGKPETFMGLAGLGDLVLTCTDDQSRNRRLGLALGRGEGLQASLEKIGQAVEGVKTAPEIARLASEQGVEMPITEQVCRVVLQQSSPQAAVEALLGREPKAEH